MNKLFLLKGFIITCAALSGCNGNEPWVNHEPIIKSTQRSYAPLTQESKEKVLKIIKSLDSSVSSDINLSELTLFDCKVTNIRGPKNTNLIDTNSFQEYYAIQYLGEIILFNADSINEIKNFREANYSFGRANFLESSWKKKYSIFSECQIIKNTLFNNSHKYPIIIPLQNRTYKDHRSIEYARRPGNELLDTSMRDSLNSIYIGSSVVSLNSGNGSIFDILTLVASGISAISSASKKEKAKKAEESIQKYADVYQCVLYNKQGLTNLKLTNKLEVLVTKQNVYYSLDDNRTFRDSTVINGGLRYKNTFFSGNNLYYYESDDVTSNVNSLYKYNCLIQTLKE